MHNKAQHPALNNHNNNNHTSDHHNKTQNGQITGNNLKKINTHLTCVHTHIHTPCPQKALDRVEGMPLQYNNSTTKTCILINNLFKQKKAS